MDALKLIFKVNRIIKKKNIRNFLFVDSFGGIHHLFYILQNSIKIKEETLIICANKEIYSFLKKIKNVPENIIYYKYKNNLLISFYKILPLIILKFFMNKIENIYAYKIVVDPIRFLIINIFISSESNILVHDQFINFYIFKKKTFLKTFILDFTNLFLPVNLKLYIHKDLDEGVYPSINKKYNKKIVDYTWQDINKNFFNLKRLKKKNSLLVIDDTIHLLSKLKYIDLESSKKNMLIGINQFLKKNKINKVYSKDHPNSKRPNILIKIIKNKKIQKIKNNLPLELIIQDFKYCIFSSSSAFYYKANTKLYNISKMMKFVDSKSYDNYFYLLKKTCKNNIKKLKFL